eukprot:3789422-Karenia_brevis.AAC.1
MPAAADLLTLPYWDLTQMPGHWYGDASGGEHSADPELRRVAWSIVLIGLEDHDFDLQGALSSALAGENQSVNR